MRLCFIDYETFWSVTHSLTKMNPIVYVMHPETEIQSLAIAMDDGPISVLFGEDEIRAHFAAIDWSDVMVVGHNNAGFDALIHAWRFGIKPKAWGCTLAMARPFYGVTVGVGLAKVAKALGLPPKGSLEAVNTKGKKLKDFTAEEIESMRVYNKHDTWLCREIFHTLNAKLPIEEMKLIDHAVRMAVELQFKADRAMLEQAMLIEIDKKNASLVELASICGVWNDAMTNEEVADAMRPHVMSQPKFALLLEKLGAQIPMKPSPKVKDEDGNPKMIPALAKNDLGMEDLLEHWDHRVQMAAVTRLEVKSTQLETRLKTYLDVSEVLDGYLPVPLNYCGAAVTWRASGAMKMNMQNLPRIDRRDPKSTDALRHSIVVPDGKVVVVVDSSNIELRVTHGLAGQEDTLVKLRSTVEEERDLYCWFASELYGRVIVKSDVLERFIGKVAMLSLQYGSGWPKYQNTVRNLSKGKTILSDEEAMDAVNRWRALFTSIAGEDGLWDNCGKALWNLTRGVEAPIDAEELCWTSSDGKILTPAGHWLQYPDLRREAKEGSSKMEWKYGRGQNQKRIYGAHLTENLAQHISRIIVMEQTLTLKRYFRVALSCHDEAVMVVDEKDAEKARETAIEIFSTPPKWWRALPLAAEAGIGKTYGSAK